MVIWRFRSRGGRAYAGRKAVDLTAEPVPGTRYDILPHHDVFEGRHFVVDAANDRGEILSKYVTMPYADEHRDLLMLTLLEAEGWSIGLDDSDD